MLYRPSRRDLLRYTPVGFLAHKLRGQTVSFPGPGMPAETGASWTITNHKVGQASAGTGSPNLAAPAFDNALTNGSTIIAFVFNGAVSGDTFSVTDTAGNTYSDCGAGAGQTGGATATIQVFVAANSNTTASNVVTFHSSGSTNYPRIIAFEVVGGAASAVDVTSKVENQTSSSGSADNCSAGAVTTSTNDELVFCGFADIVDTVTNGVSPAPTAIDSWTNITAEYYIKATAGSITGTASEPTSGIGYGAIVVALKH